MHNSVIEFREQNSNWITKSLHVLIFNSGLSYFLLSIFVGVFDLTLVSTLLPTFLLAFASNYSAFYLLLNDVDRNIIRKLYATTESLIYFVNFLSLFIRTDIADRCDSVIKFVFPVFMTLPLILFFSFRTNPYTEDRLLWLIYSFLSVLTKPTIAIYYLLISPTTLPYIFISAIGIENGIIFLYLFIANLFRKTD